MANKDFSTNLLVILLLSLAPTVQAADMSSDSYRITTSVISGGGGFAESESGNFKGEFTIGQSTPLMDQNAATVPPQSSSYNLYPGFYYTTAGSCFGDTPPFDNDVDGADLAAYAAAGDFTDIASFAAAFGRLCD